MKRKEYEKNLRKLQTQLCRLQDWVVDKGLRVIVVFEGRDAAGKGGTIKAIMERVSPRIFRLVALPAPSDREKTQLYVQRYIQYFPAAGEVIIFDRSWYNRAGVEYVMGFCAKDQYKTFLDEPVRIGDWENLASFPLTAFLVPAVSGLMLDRPITLEQPVYVPGNERHGVWASPLLETVFGPVPKVFQEAATPEGGSLNMRGDLDLLVFTFCEVRRSYAQFPARLLGDLLLQTTRGTLQTSGGELERASLENEVAYRRSTPASSLKRIERVSD